MGTPTARAPGAGETTEVSGVNSEVSHPSPTSLQQRRIAELEAQVAKLSATVATLKGSRQLSDSELRLLADRISVLTDLQQRTYMAVSMPRTAACAATPQVPSTVTSGGAPDSTAFDQDISLSEPPPEYRISTRALLRILDRLQLSPGQKRSLMLSLYPSRDLDPNNPWPGQGWH
jgi:hypothetical protein